MKVKQIQQVWNIKIITGLVDVLLTKYDTEKVYSDDPSVDIYKIATDLGIEEIIPVPSDELDGNHAVFENSKIKIDQNDSPKKQIFSIAHEIGHLVLGHIDIAAEYKVARYGATKINEQFGKLMGEKIINTPLLKKLLDDILADFFAASLLVPINRFLLWEDKPDIEIANKFRVEERCIQKRRQEINDTIPVLVLNTQAMG
jgi:Zn-dependent peptidase ImmA (M78 family)